MATEKKAVSVVLLEEYQGTHGNMHPLESMQEVAQIVGVIIGNLGKDITYRIWRTDGADQRGTVCVHLGDQTAKSHRTAAELEQSEAFEVQGLETMPLQQLGIHIHACMLTLESNFQRYRADLLSGDANQNGEREWRG